MEDVSLDRETCFVHNFVVDLFNSLKESSLSPIFNQTHSNCNETIFPEETVRIHWLALFREAKLFVLSNCRKASDANNQIQRFYLPLQKLALPNITQSPLTQSNFTSLTRVGQRKVPSSSSTTLSLVAIKFNFPPAMQLLYIVK